MLPSENKEIPWWAWIVAIAVIFLSIMMLPDDLDYHERVVQSGH
jgi:hypothetical protein